MKYIKLIALKVNEILEVDKKCCENDGCTCVILHINSNIQA